MSQHRVRRMEDLLQRELTTLLMREARDPRMQLATVSGVQMSRDLSHATVRISFLGADADRDDCMSAIRRATGFFRSSLAPRLRLRRVPELNFILDLGAEHSQRIDQLLEDLDE